MKTEYLRTASNSYMIIKDAEYLFEPYELQMVLRNKMEHLLSMQIMISDGKTEYWYDVTGMQSLAQKLTMQTAGGALVRKAAEEICGMKTELEEYLLQDIDIVYDPEMIFMDRKETSIKFCYIPGFGTEKRGGVKGLLEKFLQRLDHSDAAAVRLAYGLYERCETDDLTLRDYYDCLYGKKQKEDEAEERRMDAMMYAKASENMELSEQKRSEDVLDLVKGDVNQLKRKRRFFHREKRKIQDQSSIIYDVGSEEMESFMVAERKPSENWEETVCFSAAERKTVWVLEYKVDGLEEDLRMEQFPYRIGKHGSDVEGKLYAQTVSRMHAQITQDEEAHLWISDFNSTNGTYLNGHLIPMNTPMRIQEGDRVIFATEEYILEKK